MSPGLRSAPPASRPGLPPPVVPSVNAKSSGKRHCELDCNFNFPQFGALHPAQQCSAEQPSLRDGQDLLALDVGRLPKSIQLGWLHGDVERDRPSLGAHRKDDRIRIAGLWFSPRRGVGKLLTEKGLSLDSHQPFDLRGLGVLGENLIGLLQRRVARTAGPLGESFLDKLLEAEALSRPTAGQSCKRCPEASR